MRLILDAGAVSALAQGDPRSRAVVRVARERRARVVIPAVVVVETTRGSGPRDARVNRVLAVADVPPTDETRARVAGRLLARPGAGGKTIDAVVVAEALALPGPAEVLTGDPLDLRLLAQGQARLVIRSLTGDG